MMQMPYSYSQKSAHRAHLLVFVTDVPMFAPITLNVYPINTRKIWLEITFTWELTALRPPSYGM